MSASLDLLAGVAAANATPPTANSNSVSVSEHTSPPTPPPAAPPLSRAREGGVRKPRRSKTPPPIVEGSEADSKRALR